MAVRSSRPTRAVAASLLLTAVVGSAPAGAAPLDPGASANLTSFIVKFNAPTSVLKQSLTEDFDLNIKRPMSFGANVVTADRALDDAETSAVLDALASDPNVEYAVPNAVLTASAIPNDPRFPDQWHLQDAPVGIEMPKAWDLATGAGVTVAVLDSGRLDHPDLNPAFVGGYDFVSDLPGPGNPNPTCDGDLRDADPTDACNYGHGVRTGGTIAATTGNNEGVAGVAFGARIVPVRVLGLFASLADVIDGLNWAVGGTVPGVPPNPNPASVVNMSINGELPCLEPMQLALDAAVAAGAVVVVSAGNTSQDVSAEMPRQLHGRLSPRRGK
ncbi:S8 family serine peptidase [Smaragdicoccus niigatensis]|uniref:S8 family serine peptidase n=1 Tax=Smaragdicoccus niigatensis TaxID=359359 RepID=UPI0003A8F1E4|nr:S8 family serine peptidase [Smaragdicoccus niigatensis]